MWKPSFVLVARHGASKILAATYRYGAPPTISALAALLDEDAKQQAWQIYVADASCYMVKLWAKKSKLPFYSELIRKPQKKEDSRSGQEIVDDLVLRRRRKRRVEVSNTETV